MAQSNRKDILVSELNDFLIANGDFIVGESDNQHIRHIFQGNVGDFAEKPLLGIGIERHLNMSLTPELKAALHRKIAIQLQIDSYNASEIEITI
jgi:hypothetical protein